jgi:hypothetical protein
MWRCPKCGTQIEPGFEVCWNCGTAQDGTRAEGFRAEPADPAVPDLGPDPELPKERVADAAAPKATNERIVELCSAGNAIEAQELCNVLEEEGIHAEVVGGSLAGAAGGLVLGEPTAPRIWLRESDVARARAVLARRMAESGKESANAIGDTAVSELEPPGEPEEAELPSDRRFRFLSQGFWIAGLVCIVLGTIWARQNWTMLSKHPATTRGLLVRTGFPTVKTPVPLPGGPDQPLGKLLQPRIEFVEDMSYVYVVDHKKYNAAVADLEDAPSYATIHYDPRNPAKHIVGSIAPPWVVLAVAFGLGAFLGFVGYQFR